MSHTIFQNSLQSDSDQDSVLIKKWTYKSIEHEKEPEIEPHMYIPHKSWQRWKFNSNLKIFFQQMVLKKLDMHMHSYTLYRNSIRLDETLNCKMENSKPSRRQHKRNSAWH